MAAARRSWLARALQPTRRLQTRVSALEAGWKRHLPAFLNAVSTVGAFGHDLLRTRRDLEREISELRRQVEALAGATKPAPRLLAPERLAAARAQGIRLNLGGEGAARAGYLTIAQSEVAAADVIAPLGELPFAAGSIQELSSVHLLERIPHDELRERLLPYWHSLLQPGGRFHAIVADGDAMVRGVMDKSYALEDLRDDLFGTPERPGERAYNLLTPASLTALLEEAGFTQVEVPIRARRNGAGFEFEIAAFR